MGDECIGQTLDASGGREELPPVSVVVEHSFAAGATGSLPVASLGGPEQVPGLALASSSSEAQAK